MNSPTGCFKDICNDNWHYVPLGTIVIPHKDQRLISSEHWEKLPLVADSIIGVEVSPLLQREHITIRYRIPVNSSNVYFRVYIGAARTFTGGPISTKTNVGKSLRSCWNLLLGVVSRRLSDWNACEGHDANISSPFDIDERSLSEIFTELNPPKPQQAFLDTLAGIDDVLNHPLYSFQKSTIAAMLERESGKAMWRDPTFVLLPALVPDPNLHACWIQPSTMQAQMNPPDYTTTESGGILAEEMGAGKTVILLALILATRGQLSFPEESATDRILTSLSVRTQQSSYHRNLRHIHALPEGDRMPSLVELTLHRLALHPNALSYASPDIIQAFDSSPFATMLPQLRPFFLDTGESGRGVIKPDKKKELHHLPVYLSCSTLIAVPSSLFEQWKGEFYKFCSDGVLKALFINNSKTEIPRAQELATFDIVLTTIEWLGASNRQSSIAGHVDLCLCPPTAILPNVPVCTCNEAPLVNPIFLCRWRRLVVDEGHTSANLTTEYTVAASKLSVEHRWLVTGTPTRHLIGSITNSRSSEASDEKLRPDNSNGGEDEKDMQRLSKMIGQYLRIEPFFSQKRYFDDNVSLPMRKGWRGAKAVLEAVLQQAMIRHPIEMVDAEVQLPPMTKETTLLRLEPMQSRTYNFIQSTIIVNAVDSERTDEDYIFHPKNAKFLHTTFANLSQSLFWHADQDFFDKEIENHLHNSTSSIERAISRGKITPEDLALLKQANRVQYEAAGDDNWRKTMRREDVPFLAIGIPDDVQNAFSRYAPGVALYHSDRLLKLRNAVLDNGDIDASELLQLGEKTEKEDIIKEENVQLQRARATKKSSKPSTNKQVGQIKARKLAKEEGSSPLFGAKIVTSSSSKLNYVIQEILTYGEDAKFLIFSSSLLSLMHLADGLQLANISFLEYTSECTPSQRRTNISQFNNVPVYRVFLMELKHGARGLNLVSASRVIFLEPVWAPDVEAQAIKRVYRTGQTRPVVVKTLAIRDTVEQEMLERRAGIVARTAKMPALTEEASMRSYIEHPSFLTETGNDTTWSLPLVPVRKGRERKPVPQAREVTPMDLDKMLTSPAATQKRRRSMDMMETPGKRVRFMSPGVPMELYNDVPEALEEAINVG